MDDFCTLGLGKKYSSQSLSSDLNRKFICMTSCLINFEATRCESFIRFVVSVNGHRHIFLNNL